MQREDYCYFTDLEPKPRQHSPGAPLEWAIRARWILLLGAATWLIPIAVIAAFL